ncbi:hypothetical protein Tco_0102640, partial [Tanacetum coccineum]
MDTRWIKYSSNIGWNNISNSLFVGGTYGIAGAGVGTCPELIGPGVNRSHMLSQLIELNVNSFHDLSGSFIGNKEHQRPGKMQKPQLQPNETLVPLRRLGFFELPRQEFGSVFRQRHSAVESLALSIVGADKSDSFVETDLYLLQKLDDN